MKLLIDCDPGNGVPAADVDDGLALALAWASPGVTVVAITVVDGNVSQNQGAGIAAGLVALAGTGTPVYSSSAIPAVEDRAAWRAALTSRRDDALARELWASEPALPTGVPTPGDAPDEIVRLAIEHPDSALLALGPLTNLAAAERLSPGTLARYASVVVLGGAFTGPTGVRELNFALDPEAAQVVLASGAALTLLPLDVTRSTWLRLSDLDEISSASPVPVVDYLVATARPWVTWISRSRGWPGANAHDVLAAAITLEPDIADYAVASVAVDLGRGEARSRPYYLPADSGAARIRVVTGFDDDRFMALVRSRLGDQTTSPTRGDNNG
ncbi:MAG: nucleoside hydrolase [Rhodoglobus sp.]|nr:nucleoside hydrolase [Rhodoglobus sp.]